MADDNVQKPAGAPEQASSSGSGQSSGQSSGQGHGHSRPSGGGYGRPGGSGGGRPPRPGGGPGGPGGRKFFRRKKVCKFCVEKIDAIPYRDVRLLQGFVAESGKITPRRLSGVCTPHQRRLSRAIKQARNIALLPFSNR